MTKLKYIFRDDANAPNKVGHHDYVARHITAESTPQHRNPYRFLALHDNHPSSQHSTYLIIPCVLDILVVFVLVLEIFRGERVLVLWQPDMFVAVVLDELLLLLLLLFLLLLSSQLIFVHQIVQPLRLALLLPHVQLTVWNVAESVQYKHRINYTGNGILIKESKHSQT